MAAFATSADLIVRWRPLTAAEQTQATILLGDASAIIRAEAPTVDAQIAAGTLDADLVKAIVCGMVKRAMVASDTGEGVSAQQEQAGPFGRQVTFSNPMGNVYLTKQDKRLLGMSSRAFTIDTAPTDSGVVFIDTSWVY